MPIVAGLLRKPFENAKIFKELGVEFIEQPLKADDWEGCKEVKFSDLPIIADESCIIEEDIKCSQSFSWRNIKLMKCGGLTPGLHDSQS